MSKLPEKAKDVLILRSKDIISQNVNGKDIKIFNAKKIQAIVSDVWLFLNTFPEHGQILCLPGELDVGAKLNLIFDGQFKPELDVKDMKICLILKYEGINLKPMSDYMRNKYASRLVIEEGQ